MHRSPLSIFALFVIVAVSGSSPPALAQEEPPARVGRVSFVEGQLGFHTTGETQWSAAAVNYPVATGGSFWTDPKSKAEIRIGAQTIALSGDSEIDLTQLNEQVMQIALPQGRIGLYLRQLAQGNSVEVDIPRGGLWLLEPGRYDIEAGAPDRPARIMVFEGSARFVGGALDTGIKAGEAAVIGGTDTLMASIERAVPDGFVEWCRSRDYPEQRLAAPYYVSPEMTGFEELDAYGSWRTVPEYGQVWYPSSVAADWAPYREGHWVWLAPWGWTWVDAEPWGFAPFHYGRWARIQGSWAWLPGRFNPRPVYAPALVAFISDPGIGHPGGGFARAGVRGPAVGWFPLGPDEVYWPSYSRNPGYIRNVNLANVSQARIASITQNQPRGGRPLQAVNQNFANRAAATVVPVQTFTSAARVAPAALPVTPQVLQRARISVPPPQAAAVSGRPATSATAPIASAPITGPGSHPAGVPSATAPIAGPGPHPAGVPSATAPIAGPGGRPAGVPSATAPTAGPGGHRPGVPSAAAPTALAPAPPAAERPAPASARLPAPAAPQPVPSATATMPPPGVQMPPRVERPAPASINPPPPAAPQRAPHPEAAAPSQAVHAPPPVEHPAPASINVPPPAAPQSAPHAAPPAPPTILRGPAPEVHAAPPVAPTYAPQQAPHPAAAAPQQAPRPAAAAPQQAPHPAAAAPQQAPRPAAAAPQQAPHPAAAPAAAPQPGGGPPGKGEPKKGEPKKGEPKKDEQK